MYAFSAVDGFVDVNQGLEEMIKYVANEPSVGLFFVQQHAQNSMPNLLSVKDKIVDKTHEISLHTEDLEDSIYAVRSMTECGIPIADEMIKDINKSLHIMSTSRPRKGGFRLIQSASWGFQMGKSSSQTFGTSNISGHGPQEAVSSRSYFSAVFNSARQKASSLRWNQIDFTSENTKVDSLESSRPSTQAATAGTVSTLLDNTEVEELPLSSHIIDEQVCESNNDAGDIPTDVLLTTLDYYVKFKSEKEAKLEEWLEKLQDDKVTTEASL